MPTKHPRIMVTEDPELAHALREAAPHLTEVCTKAGLVRELALRGAEGVRQDADRRRDLLERLAARCADPDGFDREALQEVHERLGTPELP